MQCDVCKSAEASVFLTQIVGGKMQKVNLCPGCSKEKGVNDPTGFALADLLSGMGDQKSMERNPGGVQCPVCGFTQGDFKKTGRLGCSRCYDVFAEPLAGMLKNMHKGVQHTGKSPAGLRAKRERARRMKDLQQNLDAAVAAEEFEKAASLRDELRQLEAGVES